MLTVLKYNKHQGDVKQALQVGVVVVYSFEEKQTVGRRQRHNMLKKKQEKSTCLPHSTAKITYFPLEMQIYFTDGSLTANRTVTFTTIATNEIN